MRDGGNLGDPRQGIAGVGRSEPPTILHYNPAVPQNFGLPAPPNPPHAAPRRPIQYRASLVPASQFASNAVLHNFYLNRNQNSLEQNVWFR